MSGPHVGDIREGDVEFELWDGKRWVLLSEEVKRLKAIQPTPLSAAWARRQGRD
jgi:hypothetical protein